MRALVLCGAILALLFASGCGEGGLTKEQGLQLAIATAQGPLMAGLTVAPNTPQGAKVYSAVARAISIYCSGMQAGVRAINRDNINALLVNDDIAIFVACPNEDWPADPRQEEAPPE